MLFFANFVITYIAKNLIKNMRISPSTHSSNYAILTKAKSAKVRERDLGKRERE